MEQKQSSRTMKNFAKKLHLKMSLSTWKVAMAAERVHAYSDSDVGFKNQVVLQTTPQPHRHRPTAKKGRDRQTERTAGQIQIVTSCLRSLMMSTS